VPENVGGVAVALRLDGHSRFFNYGRADRRSTPISCSTSVRWARSSTPRS
jgi:hypothetical protein